MDIKKIIFGDQVGAAEAIAPANDDLQGSLPITDIKYGVVRTRDGGYAALFEVLPTNYFLQSTAERIRIISSLAAWLRIAPDNLQILCLSQPVDVEQYTRRMEGFLQSEGDALCRTCIEDNINEVNQLVRYGAFTTRFYIAYRYEPSMVSGDVSYAKIAAALRQVMDSSVGYLARCGLNVVSPGYIDNHLVETVFRMLCKRTSEHIRLPLYFRDMLQECYGVPQQPEPDPEGGEETTTQAAKQDTPPEAEERKNTGRRRKQQKTTEQFEATGVMDLICPAAVDFTHKDYIEMDGVCHAYLYIAGYGYKSLVRGGWMAALVGMGDGISVSMTLQRRSREKILPKVANSTIWSRSRIRDVDNTRADFEQMDSAITAGIYIKDQMNRAGEDYYDMYTLIEVTADDPELLETRVSDVERHCTSLELIVKRCDYLEEQAFHSFLPVVSMAPEIERKARRNALLSGVASAFPFYSMELCEQNGILIGQDMQRKSICMLDIFDSDRYNNANTIVLGTSGAGKTFLLQLIAMRYRQQGKQVCLIAPYKGYEYRAACEAIGGLYIKLAPSSTDCINFMEIREESLRARQQEESEQERNRSLLADKISQLHIYFSLLRRNLTEEDMEQLDVALTQLYRRFGINRNNNSLLDKDGSFKPQPTPTDFYDLLLEKEETKPLASVLSRFVKGSASNLGKATNIDLRNKYIVLDISEIGKDLLAFGTLLATDICMEYCKQDRAENKIIILDEIWSLIGAGSNSEAATFIQEMFKTVRGYGTAAIGASQDLEDFFALENGKFGKALLNNSRIKFALMTEPEEARLIQQHYHLTDEEMQMHARFSRGQALLCAGLNRLGVDIIASKREHDLITTDHSDLARIRDRRNYEKMRQQSVAAWEQEEDYDESAQ